MDLDVARGTLPDGAAMSGLDVDERPQLRVVR